MRRADYPETLARVAAPVLARIERDRRRAPGHLKPLLAAMAEEIFEPDLDLDHIARAAGLEAGIGGGTHPRFAELGDELGQPAWSYLREARLEIAARLLLETPISLLDVGRMVGYSSPSSFRREMRRFLGMPASEYRRRAPRILERGGPPPEGSETEEYWERMLAGELSDDQAWELDAYLARLAPASAAAPLGAAAERSRRLRRTLADGFVTTVEDLDDFADRRRFCRDAVRFPDGTFFERLSQKSRGASADRSAGDRPDRPSPAVEWALLAVDSLAANRELETCPGRAALAWARLALARWRAGDLAGAERDLGRWTRDTGRGDGGRPSWRAESGRVAAALHWHQGRRRPALEIAEPMVAAHREAGSPGLARALILRAELRAAAADLDAAGEARAELLERALADVEEARDLAAEGSQEARAAAFSLWLRILVKIGDRAEKITGLAGARRLAPDLGDDAAPRLLWLEGHCSTGGGPLAGLGRPEGLWHRARERFQALGDDLWVARTSLDLARLGGAGEASEAAARLGAVAAAPEDLAALRALAAGKVADADLDRAEDVLRRLEWRRRASRALRLAL